MAGGIRTFTSSNWQVTVQWALDVKALNKAVAKANRKALAASAKVVQREAKQLVSKGTKQRRRGRHGRFVKSRSMASQPFQPPFKKSGNLQRSIKYSVGKSVVWVGAVKPKGAHGQLLTWGRSPTARTGQMLPRPFMQPALERVRSTLPSKWANKL